MHQKTDTSWETSSSWYDKLVGTKGHYYHQQVIIPGILNILEREKKTQPHVLDLACGQGVLARHLPKGFKYLGIDASASLLESAKSYQIKGQQQFFLHDLSHPLSLPFQDFTHAVCILAVQNFAHPLTLFRTAYAHLRPGSPFILVINHPCFRIPRQSNWGIDAEKKWQYRRIDRYMTPLKIPIQTHPSQEESETTLTFHLPLSQYSLLLKQSGFVIDYLEEWCSDKKSIGKNAAMENKSRIEFPLFLAIIAKKV
ncbi:MAG TPA: class I SAM-dependent methyltransferase [Rhabdochlamydiaceae bacterium]|jgi:SAM-dependent methyltransferase